MFAQIQSTGIGRYEVQREARMPGQPAARAGVAMLVVFVENQMQVLPPSIPLADGAIWPLFGAKYPLTDRRASGTLCLFTISGPRVVGTFCRTIGLGKID